MAMTARRPCPNCGAEIPDHGLGGHCPRCLVSKVMLGVEDGTGLGMVLRRFGDFEIIGEIARGGMGVVYRARQPSLDRMVALKMILAGEFATSESVKRFRNEAAAAARLRHPNIVTIHEVGEVDGQHYFAMELVEGPSLAALVRDGPIAARRAAGYVKRVADAVAHAHGQRVLHRDLKPSNILLDPFDQPRVTDFGLARQLDSASELTASGQAFGSPGYMAPEQASGRSDEVSAAADVYGMGAVLYHLLTGRPPFQGESVHAVIRQVIEDDPVPPRRLNPSVPLDLETVCLKCLDKEPSRRYGAAQDLADELERFLNDEPILARPLGHAARAARWIRRHPTVAGLGAAVLILLLVLAIGSTMAAWRIARAQKAEHDERQRAELANRDLSSANERLATTVQLLELQRAEDLFRVEDPSSGVAHLASIVRRDPSNHVAASRLVSALVHRNWAVPVASPVPHWKPVEKVRFSPDGRWVLSTSRESLARLTDASSGQLVANFSHADRIHSANFSPDGARVITASADGTARIWNARTGAVAALILQHPAKVHSADFSPDGGRALTMAADRTARIWDARSGTRLHELTGHARPLLAARFSPDGQSIATASDTGSVRIWDAMTGQLRHRMANRLSRTTAVEFSPDGRRLVWTGEGGGAQLWDVAEGKSVGPPLIHRTPSESVWHAAFSPDSRLVLTFCQDGTVRWWEAADGRFVWERAAHDGGIDFGGFSADGRLMVTASSDNSARIWTSATRASYCQPLRQMERMLHAVFSPAGDRVATASFDSVVQVWDIRNRRYEAEAVRPPNRSPSILVAIHPAGNQLLVVTKDRRAHLFDLSSATAMHRLPLAAEGVQTAGFSRDGSKVATGSTNGLAQIWDSGSGGRLAEIAEKHRRPVTTLDFSPQGDRLATGAVDGSARIWDVATGAAMGTALQHQNEVLRVRFSPDGSRLATASEDSSARVWDGRTGAPLTRALPHMDHVKFVEFSPDGERLLTASTDNTACLWSIASSQPVAPSLRHARIVERALFSPDGTRVATISLDRTARVWDARTGQALTEPMRHDSPVTRAAFSRDGRRLLTASANGRARLWDPATGLALSEWLSVGGQPDLAFGPAGDRFVSAADAVRVWELPETPVPVPGWFSLFCETIGGVRRSARGDIEIVERKSLESFIPTTDESASNQDVGTFYRRLARWFIADPQVRPASPFGGSSSSPPKP